MRRRSRSVPSNERADCGSSRLQTPKNPVATSGVSAKSLGQTTMRGEPEGQQTFFASRLINAAESVTVDEPINVTRQSEQRPLHSHVPTARLTARRGKLTLVHTHTQASRSRRPASFKPRFFQYLHPINDSCTTSSEASELALSACSPPTRKRS